MLLVKSSGQPHYCTRAAGIFNESIGVDSTNDCFSSGHYNLTNVCFRCLGVGYATCGSIYNFGGVDCLDSTIQIQAATACGGTNFECNYNVGTDNSQFLGTTPMPTVSPSIKSPVKSATTPPTNTAVKHGALFVVYTILFILMSA